MEGSPRSVYETLKRKAEGTLASKLFKTPKLSEATSTYTSIIAHSPQVTAISSGRAPQRGQTGTMTKNHLNSPIMKQSTSNTTRRSPETINSSGVTSESQKSPSPFAIDNEHASLKNHRRSTPYAMQFSRSTVIDVDAVPIRMTPKSNTVASPRGTAGQRPPRSSPSVVIDLDLDSDGSRQKPPNSRPSVTIDLDSDGDDSSSRPTTNRSSLHVSHLRHTFATTTKESSLAMVQEATRQTIDQLEPASEPASQVLATPPSDKSNTLEHDTNQSRQPPKSRSTSTVTSDTSTSTTMSSRHDEDQLLSVNSNLPNPPQTNPTSEIDMIKPQHQQFESNPNVPSHSEDELTEVPEAAKKLAEEETKKDDDAATNGIEEEETKDEDTAMNSLEEDTAQEYDSETLSEDEACSDTESDNDTDEEVEEDDEIVELRRKLDQLSRAKQRKEQQKVQRKAAEEAAAIEAAGIEAARIETEKAKNERVVRPTLTQERLDAERQDEKRRETERLQRERIMNERTISSNGSRSEVNEYDDEENAWKDFTRAQGLVNSEKDQAHPNEASQETSQPPTESVRLDTDGNPPTPISAQRFWSTQSEPVFGQVFKYDKATGSKIGKIGLEEAADLVRRHEGKPIPARTSLPTAHGTNALGKLRAEAQKDAERIRAQQAKPVSQDPALLEQIRQQAQQDIGNLKKGILPVNDNDSQVQASTTSGCSTPEYPQFVRSVTHTVEGYSPSLTNHNIFRKPTKRNRPKIKEKVVIPLEKVTQDDWYLIELVKQGLSWSQIHEIWEAKTGVPRGIDFYKYRYRRMQTTFPDHIPPLSSPITLNTKLQKHPAHTEKDVMAAIFAATPDPSSSAEVSTPRPTTGGKTITPEMARYFLARSPTPESTEESDEEEEDTMLQVAKPSSSNLKQDKHHVHYTYQVERKVVLGGRNPSDVPWIAQSEEIRSKKAANVIANGAIYTNHDRLDFKFDETRGRFNKVSGLWSAEAIGEEGTIYVRVNRRLRYSQEGVLVDKALPFTVYDVLEKRTITITTKEWKLRSSPELDHEHADQTLSGKVDDVSGDKDLETELEEALSQDDEEQAIPSSGDEASQHRTLRDDNAQVSANNSSNSTLNNPVVNANENDKDLDDLFHEDNDDADMKQTPAEKKHVHFADSDKVRIYQRPDDTTKSPEPSTNHVEAEAEAGAGAGAEAMADTDTETGIHIDLSNYTLHTTNTSTSTTSIAANTIYTHLHLANEAALQRLYTLRTSSASASFLSNPTIDANDFSLNWKIPGRMSLDRIPHENRVRAEMDERLAQLDALEEETLEGGSGGGEGEFAWSQAVMRDEMKGTAWTRVESWDGVNEQDEDEEDETAVRIRVTTATEVEIWVQARKIEGPRNP